MIIKTLKKTGRAVLLLFLAVTSVNANEQIIEATISPGRIGVGERATLSLKVPDGEGDIKPVKVPAVRGLRIDYSGAQHSFQFINGRTWRGMTLNFTITAEKRVHTISPPLFLNVARTVSSHSRFPSPLCEG